MDLFFKSKRVESSWGERDGERAGQAPEEKEGETALESDAASFDNVQKERGRRWDRR